VTPEISVVIPNWNGIHLLPTCLRSLHAQRFKDFEVIVSDDGSTDDSPDLIARDYPEVRLLRSPANRGFCQAANAGLRASRGRLVMLLNNDTEADPECLGELAAAMNSDKSLGICAAKLVYSDDPSLINAAGHACRPDGVVVDIGRGRPDGEWFSTPREVLGGSGGAVLYRRRMLDEIGLFDPAFITSVEDVDLDWRAQWAGWRAAYVPTAVVKHREGISREITGPRAIFLGLRNTAFVWVKDWPVPSLVRHFGDMWRGLCANTFSSIRRGYAGLLPAVVWSLLVHMPRMMSRRRRLRRSRRVPPARFEAMLALGAQQTRQSQEHR
jgi:hypothetical protein